MPISSLHDKQIGRQHLVILIVLTLFEIKAVNMMHIAMADRIVSAAHGIVIGVPQWRIYQNRLLGPWLVFGLSRLFFGGKYAHAYSAVTSISLLAVNILTYRLFLRLGTPRPNALGYALAGMAAFVALQDQEWLYLWDYLDLLVFTAFVYGVYTNRRWPYFLVLFLIELFNREAAAYISLWMILDSVTLRDSETKIAYWREWYKFDVLSFVVGVVTFIAGTFWTQWIRLRLFKHSEFPDVGLDLNHLHGNTLSLSGNIADFLKDMTATTPQMYFLDFLIIPALLLYFWKIRHFLSLTSLKLVAIILVMLLGIILYAKIAEPRVFLSILPLMLFLNWDVSRLGRGRALPTQEGFDTITPAGL
jgi:hypothetical protein